MDIQVHAHKFSWNQRYDTILKKFYDFHMCVHAHTHICVHVIIIIIINKTNEIFEVVRVTVLRLWSSEL